MHLSVLLLASYLTIGIIGNPLGDYNADIKRADTNGSCSAPPPAAAPPPGAAPQGGKKLQATVTGYNNCLTQGMACGLTGAPGKDPTGAMSAYLIPQYGKGNCGTCWKLSNVRELNYPGGGQVPTVGGPLKSPQGNGMVVLINNSCAPGPDQYQPGAVGQCAQSDSHPTDKLGSQTVLDLCKDTNAVEMLWGSPNPGMAVADLEEVDCSEWSGHVSKAS